MKDHCRDMQAEPYGNNGNMIQKRKNAGEKRLKTINRRHQSDRYMQKIPPGIYRGEIFCYGSVEK